MKIGNGLLWTLFLLLAACGPGMESQPGGPSGESGGFSAPLPDRLQKIVSGTLTAEIVVDGGAPVALTVSATGVTGTINNLSVGSHTFVINYYVNGIIVATASATGTITAGGTTAITFAANAITYPDSDNDGFTNLAEVEIGTNPNDAASRPPAESPRRSANYVMADVIGTSPVVGETSSTSYKVVTIAPLGKSASANYTLGP